MEGGEAGARTAPHGQDNYKKKVRGDAIWREAAKILAGTDVEASAETVRKSYTLIKRAGGAQVTLPSYRREVEERDRRRKNKSG